MAQGSQERRQGLFEYVILYHPRPAGDEPKSVLVKKGEILAYSQKEVEILLAREIPEQYLGDLSRIEMQIRYFQGGPY